MLLFEKRTEELLRPGLSLSGQAEAKTDKSFRLFFQESRPCLSMEDYVHG
jgi:hypothetical protein